MQNGSDALQLVIERIKQATNILVTVEKNPSVDELAGALALTLLLNKMDKRGTAVFSGAIPPAINFLEPGKTFEPTVDSLRDFIIALDKEKADRLSYKVDGDVVKISITPYRTVLSSKDLKFSEGDFNVDVVIALGVEKKESLDKAIAAHGRILHDATVITLNNRQDQNELGALDWQNPQASSICEMLAALASTLDPQLLDVQISTALLTGIVAATERFSNDRTNAHVMNVAAELMAAGANQQLIANNLQAKNQQASEISKEDETSIEEEILGLTTSGKKALTEKPQKIEKKKPAEAEEPRAEQQEESVPKKKEEKGALTVAHKPKAEVPPPQEAIPDEVDAPDAPAIPVEPTQDGLAAALESAAQNVPPMPSPATASIAMPPEMPPVQESPLLPPAEPATTALPQIRPLNQRTDGRAPHQELEPPTMGGTLNATAAEAAEEKQRQAAEEEKKKVTLMHRPPTIGPNVSAPQPPAAVPMPPAPQAAPILPPLPPAPADMPPLPPMPAAPMPASPPLPPAPVPAPPSPTDAAPQPSAAVSPPSPDIDLETARRAVTDAFQAQPFDSAGRPITDHPVQTLSDLPPAPAPGQNGTAPPLPDFGSLPPLPAVQNLYSQPSPGQDVTQQFITPDQMQAPVPAPGLPQAQPPAPAPAPGQITPNPNDPNQFQIPGQQPPQPGQ